MLQIFPLLLTTVNTVKSKGKISQNFVAFSEYMNFNFAKERLSTHFDTPREDKTAVS